MGGQQHTPEPWYVDSLIKGKIENLIIRQKPDSKWGFPKPICQFYSRTDNDFENHHANAERIVACVNAMAGKPAPERWVSEAETILNSIYSFEHPQLKLGSSKVEVLLKMAKERDQLLEQLKKLLHMHSCEQEGIIMPTAAQWFQAVNEAEEVAFKIDPSPYQPNE